MSFSRDEALAVKNAFLSAAAALDNKKEWINELNVFPVPDGDTGTNMTLTIMNAANDVANLSNPEMTDVCKTIKNGSLRGARGNSGVILSQLLSGFTKGLLEYGEITIQNVAAAFQKAVETAYKAVMKPKEGTILTVAKAMSEEAVRKATDCNDLTEFLNSVIAEGEATLQKTPDMLPVLKQAGVVDAGGQGLMVIMHGALSSLTGNSIEFKGLTGGQSGAAVAAASNEIDTADIKFGYCTEFIINGTMDEQEVKDFKAYLETIGDSIVVVADDDIVKVHVHNNEPGNVIQRALSFGELSHIKIDNMREEHNELYKSAQHEKKKPRKAVGSVSVSVGNGFKNIFNELGVDNIISGGQTMNPSAEDIAKAIEETNADVVYVLPNNKNIIMAANQAADIVDDCKVVVIPTKSICQGVIALLNLDPCLDPDDNLSSIGDALADVKTCEVTYAVRDTSIDGFDIKTDSIMAIGDKGMLAVSDNIDTAVLNAIERTVDDDTEMVTIYYGEDIKEEEANALTSEAQERYPDVEFSLNYGGQPVYFYMISIE